MRFMFRSPTRQLLVASSALSLCLPVWLSTAGEAATTVTTGTASTAHTKKKHAKAVAVTAAPAAAPAPVQARKPVAIAAAPESISVIGQNPVQSANGVTGRAPGGGLMSIETEAHSQTTISRDFIAKLAPSTSAAQMIQYAPGTNVGSSDAFGLSDAVVISIRGMQQSEVGYLYDGAPIADVDSYAPYTSEWGDTENYQEVKLSQGSSSLDAPLMNATAGTMNIVTRDPSRKFGGLIDYSYGSFKTQRGFIRVDSGELGHSGVYGYISFSNATYDPWRGPGRGLRRHFDSSLLKQWGEGNEVRLVEAFNMNNQPGYNNVTLAQWKANNSHGNLDTGGNNFSSDPTSAEYWKLALGPWRDLILDAPMKFTLTSKLHLKVTPYYYWGSGGGGFGWGQLGLTGNYLGTQALGALVPTYPNLVQTDSSGNQSVNAQAYYIIEEFHPGINASLDYDLDRHNKITFGSWYDYYDDHQQENMQQVAANGDVNYWGGSGLKTASGQELYLLDYHLITQTVGLYVGEAASYLNDRLKINIGFKDVMVTRYGTNNLPGSQYHFGTNIQEPMPRFQASYKINDKDQVFISATTNFRMPTANSYFTSYDGGSVSGVGNSSLKNEYAITEELGYRHYGLLTYAMTLFNVNMTNRNVSSSVYENGYNYSTTLNAGGQTIRGIDAEFGTHPWHHFSPYFSAEYLNTSIDNNLAVGSDYLPTKGKQAVLAPKWTVTGSLSYDDSANFATFTYRWVDRQYSDLMNQEAMPSHGQIDLSLGHRFPSMWHFQHPQVQLNMINLANWHYLSGVSSISTNARDTTGIYGTTISGSSPAYYVATGFAIMGTVTTGF